jgi:hypothetical protein
MLLKDVMKALDHKVVDTAEYQWKCFGSNARFMDFKSDYSHVSVVFDTETHTIYQATIEPIVMKDHDGPYRWVNPNWADALFDEARERKVDESKAWDDVEWINLDLSEDFLEKAIAIFNGKKYDRRILVKIELPELAWAKLIVLADEKGVSQEKLINHILRRQVRLEERALRAK